MRWIRPRQLLLMLGLLAASTGTPLRIAEAAHDLERYLVERTEPASLFEVDGGVGDDPGETITREATGAPEPDGMPALVASPPTPTRGAPGLAPLVEGPPPYPDPPPRRRARLQCFLF